MVAGVALGSLGTAALPEGEAAADPPPTISITEEILQLQDEMAGREARGESTTMQLQKINELVARQKVGSGI